MDDKTIKEILLEILSELKNIRLSMLTSFKEPIEIGDFVYERVASTMSNPVPAGAKKHVLIYWDEPQKRGREFALVGVASDQHDNSYYYWEVDGTLLPISGEVRVGDFYDPFIFPRPITVRRYIKFMVDNNNLKAYPNPGGEPDDPVPYEGMFFGFWKRD